MSDDQKAKAPALPDTLTEEEAALLLRAIRKVEWDLRERVVRFFKTWLVVGLLCGGAGILYQLSSLRETIAQGVARQLAADAKFQQIAAEELAKAHAPASAEIDRILDHARTVQKQLDDENTKALEVLQRELLKAIEMIDRLQASPTSCGA